MNIEKFKMKNTHVGAGPVSAQNHRGITLIALIITIIVLIILAGVAITLAIDSDGLFSKANEAVGKWNNAIATEETMLSELMQEINNEFKEEETTQVEIESITLSATQAVLEVGQTKTLTATINPINATNQKITWSSSNPDIVTVDSEGTITVIKKGEVTITATTADGGKTANCIVNPFEKVNHPEVKEGMIAVYYDNGWKKADETSTDWYNYHETRKEWANVVTVKEIGTKTRSYYETASVGEPIAEEDILAMFVWIPRYSYKIAEGYHTLAGQGDIQIKFLNSTKDETFKGETAIRSSLTYGVQYVVHPAFTSDNIGEEITGMWVGKFESSNASSPINNAGMTGAATETANDNLKKGLGDGTTQDVTIRANVTSWRWTNITTFFEVAQAMNDSGNIHGLSTDTDTMMMKNSQWGAVAYLAQSNYGNKQVLSDDTSGIWNNPYNEGYVYKYEGSDTETNPYSTTLTGMAGGYRNDATMAYSMMQEGTKTDNGDSITIKYNNINPVADGGGLSGTLGEEFTKTFYKYNTENGVKASTTRNIYGIYDMSGGANEFMASFLGNGTTSYVTEMLTKDAKYIEVYAGDAESGEDKFANYNANASVYGDAIYEVSNVDTDTNTLLCWYSAPLEYPTSSDPFFTRGWSYTTWGMFGVNWGSGYLGGGGSYRNYGFRIIAL